jgi:hypothetical protein
MRILLAILTVTAVLTAQSQPLAGEARAGLSVFTGDGGSTSLMIGGLLDIPLQGRLSVMPHLDFTTHSGNPIEIGGLVKYSPPYLLAGGKTFLDAGLGIWFYSGGSALGMDFGGGAYFPVADGKAAIPVELRLGPVFQSGNTIFQIGFSSGIRFDL